MKLPCKILFAGLLIITAALISGFISPPDKTGKSFVQTDILTRYLRIEEISMLMLGWNLSTKNLADEIFNYSLVMQAGAEKASELIPDWDESYSVIPGGASGVPDREFYLSQADTYIKGKFFKDHFSDDAVRASAKYTLILKPEN